MMFCLFIFCSLMFFRDNSHRKIGQRLFSLSLCAISPSFSATDNIPEASVLSFQLLCISFLFPHLLSLHNLRSDSLPPFILHLLCPMPHVCLSLCTLSPFAPASVFQSPFSSVHLRPFAPQHSRISFSEGSSIAGLDFGTFLQAERCFWIWISFGRVLAGFE